MWIQQSRVIFQHTFTHILIQVSVRPPSSTDLGCSVNFINENYDEIYWSTTRFSITTRDDYQHALSFTKKDETKCSLRNGNFAKISLHFRWRKKDVSSVPFYVSRARDGFVSASYIQQNYTNKRRHRFVRGEAVWSLERVLQSWRDT